MKRTSRNRDRITIPFRSFHSGISTLVAGAATTTTNLDATFTSRISDLSDDYMLYRFKEVKLTLYAPAVIESTVNETVSVSLSYLSSISDVPPATEAQVATMEHRVFNGCHIFRESAGGSSVPYDSTRQSFRLGPDTLISDVVNKWYKTKPSSNVQAFDEVQGQVFLVCDSSASSISQIGWAWDVEGVIEFCSPVASGQTPMTAGRAAKYLPLGPNQPGVLQSPANVTPGNLACAPGMPSRDEVLPPGRRR